MITGYWAVRKRKDVAGGAPRALDFNGKLVYLDCVSRAAVGGQPFAVAQGFAFIDSTLGADVIVATDPLQPTSCEGIWALALLGGCCCTADYIQTKCSKGVALFYRAACKQKKRIIYCSPLFQERHAHLHAVVAYACFMPDTLWSFFSGAGQFEFLRSAATRTHASSCTAFLVASEYDSAEFAHVQQKYTIDNALAALVDVSLKPSS